MLAVVDWGRALDWEGLGFHRYSVQELDLAPEEGIVAVVFGVDYRKSLTLVQQISEDLNRKEAEALGREYIGPDRRSHVQGIARVEDGEGGGELSVCGLLDTEADGGSGEHASGDPD